MEWLCWIFISALFIFSFVGLIYPVIPSVLLLWIGFGLYYFLINPNEISLFFWLSMLGLTILLFIVDFIANSHFVKKSGGSKLGERVALITTIIGSFIIPPFGIIVIPFISVFIAEYTQKKNVKDALKVAVATIIGFLSSTVAKGLIQMAMIIWFILEVII